MKQAGLIFARGMRADDAPCERPEGYDTLWSLNSWSISEDVLHGWVDFLRRDLASRSSTKPRLYAASYEKIDKRYSSGHSTSRRVPDECAKTRHVYTQRIKDGQSIGQLRWTVGGMSSLEQCNAVGDEAPGIVEGESDLQDPVYNQLIEWR